jgi:UDP-2,3-diacylglucosamine hydrolase
MILIADAHIDEQRDYLADFFEMLEVVSRTDHDVVFLGDIFELWIAMDRYERPLHHDFMDWCRREKQHRTIGFAEGNHEYFIARHRSHCFSWCTASGYHDSENGILFCHGDLINRKDLNYRRFRRMVKNRLGEALIGQLPAGPRLSLLTKRQLKHTNLEFRKRFPYDEIQAFARRNLMDGIRCVVAGHYHRTYRYIQGGAGVLHLLPAWGASGEVGVLDEQNHSLELLPWRDLGYNRRLKNPNVSV